VAPASLWRCTTATEAFFRQLALSRSWRIGWRIESTSTIDDATADISRTGRNNRNAHHAFF
jgi:hypothetical protein